MFFIRFRLKRALLAIGVMAAACAFTALGIFLVQHGAWRAAANPAACPDPVILLDAGHGGEDGGAVGVGGVVEKDLNLAITLKLENFLRAMGYQTVLTRVSDSDLHDAAASTTRERKTTDIHNRFAMQEALRDKDLFVSIHMNKFPGNGAHGTQVFYSKNTPLSAVLAQAIQESVVRLVQPENTRQIKPSGDSIYLLYYAKRTAVMVECGFLSNAGDAEKLQQDEYQNQIAFAIACGVLEYCKGDIP
ncbi:MAG: N-acetylmuramoyl-L-alanine amidase [Oscillospiraceae bacterium]|jgi:N-acetylmuramoyl-L-alanine amidase|nr:N-acetylmuramoyl-L-alanine amidase [Oscillospiraceae bacterium]